MMRTRFLLAGLLSLALAACSSGATPAPSVEPSAQPPEAPVPSAEPTAQPPEAPAPTPTPAVLDVKVTFDGETCTYLGPSVIPDGTVLQFEYAPDQQVAGSSLIVYAVKPGTTADMFFENGPNGSGTVSDAPDWALQPTAAWTTGTSTLLYTIESVTQGKDDVDYTVGGYQVACNTPYIFLAAQLSVAGA